MQCEPQTLLLRDRLGHGRSLVTVSFHHLSVMVHQFALLFHQAPRVLALTFRVFPCVLTWIECHEQMYARRPPWIPGLKLLPWSIADTPIADGLPWQLLQARGVRGNRFVQRCPAERAKFGDHLLAELSIIRAVDARPHLSDPTVLFPRPRRLPGQRGSWAEGEGR